jgi:hypothetical protein
MVPRLGRQPLSDQFPGNTFRVTVPTKMNPRVGVPKMKYGSVIPG